MPKIVIVGAGSMVFAKKIIGDMLDFEALKEMNLYLVDIDDKRLKYAEKMTRRIASDLKANPEIMISNEYKEVIKGADFVINIVDIGGYSAMLKDFKIPEKYGLKQTVADTLGIGGIFRASRVVPFAVQLAKDMEEACPQATLINYSNPMGITVGSILRRTNIQAVGICHGTQWTHSSLRFYASLAEMSTEERKKLLNNAEDRFHCWEGEAGGIPMSETNILGAGINHMNFILKFEHLGRDLYPQIFDVIEDPEVFKLDPVRFELMKTLGYFMTETSWHTAEYLPYFMKNDDEISRLDIEPGWYIKMCDNKSGPMMNKFMELVDDETAQIVDLPYEQTVEYAGKIINAITTGTPFLFNGNTLNHCSSLIKNLPYETCVEVPCVADRNGIKGTCVGELPPQCAALARTNINVQDLTIRAIEEKSKKRLYQAAMMDPNASSSLTLPQIRNLIDEMCEAHKEHVEFY
jgi:alpha-galactosidase